MNSLWEAFLAGFEASGEGWNGEWPFGSGLEIKDARTDTKLFQKFEEWVEVYSKENSKAENPQPRPSIKGHSKAPAPEADEASLVDNPVPLPWAVMHVGEAAMWAAEPLGGADYSDEALYNFFPKSGPS